MGMDVFGLEPTDEKGEYFRNNVWFWRPLVQYCNIVSPEIDDNWELWHYNDGHRLDSKKTLKLSKALYTELESGRTEKFKKEYYHELGRLEKIICNFCGGNGVRPSLENRICPDTYDDPLETSRQPHPRAGKMGWCNACDGVGTKRNSSCSYGFSENNVNKFAEFLEHCGGFEIR